MSKKIITHNNGIVETRETFYTEKTIQQLKQQLAEKDKEIEKLKQEKKNAGEEKARAYLDTLTKPKIIELCLQYINDKNIAEQQLEALMLEISKQEVEQHDLPDYCTRTGTDCTYLGKIEEVKELLLIESKNNPIIYDVNDDAVGGALDRDKTFEVIDQQIKELKGEKDETQNK